MSFYEILLTAVALAMDAFAISVSSAMGIKDFKLRHSLKFGLYFGFFQFIMPVLGFYLAFSFSKYIAMFNHWVAFILLLLIGANMIYSAYKGDEPDFETKDALGFKNMLMMAVATSIDAMAIGISLAFLDSAIFFPAVIIGLTSFALSCAGAVIGSKIGGVFKGKAGYLGGFILICIGIKILISH